MLRGTRIIVGQEAADYSDLIETFRSICINYGYEEVIIPSIWEQQTFTDKAGSEILNQMYTFKDKKDRDICLIPEVTAIIQEEWRTNWRKSWKNPSKIFYVSRCYRYERPQAGRYREFTQFGVEFLGEPKVDVRPNVIGMARVLMEATGLYRDTGDWVLNESVRRGLSYYTEDGFEIECPILGAQKQVCGGGRYAEGIGFAIGIDRLLLAKNLLDKDKS